MTEKTTYKPSNKTLEKYAKLMVHYAIANGNGVKKGDVVQLISEEEAKPLFMAIYAELIKSGAHVITSYRPSDTIEHKMQRIFLENANSDQLNFYPKHYYNGLIKTIDHSVYIHVETDKKALESVDPAKIMQSSASIKRWREMREKKELAGKFSWTLCLYGSQEMADHAGLTLEEYWKEIIKACYLDKADPVKEWKKIATKQLSLKEKLDSLPVEYLHVKGVDADLKIKFGEQRQWMGGTGQNIPSYELFCSPDWRGTEGWIRFSEPLYRYGSIIEGVELWFQKGRVVKSKATRGEKVLQQMIATENADKIGEYSLTDKRFSRITKFMAETLYDENVGGRNGNTHLALGNAYKDGYTGDVTKMKRSDWKRLGFNESSVHTDIMSTTPRTVTAILKDGTEKVIYKNGMFTL